MKLDINSPEDVWCVGIIKRILFRGERKKFVVVTYENLPVIYNEEIIVTSNRLSNFKFFTGREDIPKM